jgi:hypothetical protein
MSHMKGTSPDLTFVQVDVGAAVDVMYLIDKVSAGYSRKKIGEFDTSVPSGDVAGMDFDEEFDEDDWDEEDDEFLGTPSVPSGDVAGVDFNEELDEDDWDEEDDEFLGTP